MTKGHVCDNCKVSLKESDYKKAFSWDYKCCGCGFNYKHNGIPVKDQIEKQGC